MADSSTAIHPMSAGTTDMGVGFPIRDLSMAGRVDFAGFDGVSNATVGAHDAPVDAAASPFPATLWLCRAANCTGCYTFDMSTMPVNQCLKDTSSAFVSVGIVQPSGAGMSSYKAVVARSGCPNLIEIPGVNTCYDINAPLTNFALIM